MYNTIKNVLEAGRFELTNILAKIDALWLRGSITDEEHTELCNLAQSKAKTENSTDLIAKISELEKKVQNIEAKLSGEEKPDGDEYPAFEVGKWYYKGDKIAFDGKKYTCIAPEGTVCVWNPKDYPTYWEIDE